MSVFQPDLASKSEIATPQDDIALQSGNLKKNSSQKQHPRTAALTSADGSDTLSKRPTTAPADVGYAWVIAICVFAQVSLTPHHSSNENTESIAECLHLGHGHQCVHLFQFYSIALCSFTLATAFGVYLSFFLDQDQYPHATRLDFAFIGGLQVGVALLSSVSANFSPFHLHFPPSS